MIHRRVEYVRCCDNDADGCYYAEADSTWETRALAVQAALKDGWLRLTYGRWLCPKCAAKLFPQAVAANQRHEAPEHDEYGP